MGSQISRADLGRMADSTQRAFDTIEKTISEFQPAVPDDQRRNVTNASRYAATKILGLHDSIVGVQKSVSAFPSILGAIRYAAIAAQGRDLTAGAAQLRKVHPAANDLPLTVGEFFAQVADVVSAIRTTVPEIEPDVGAQPGLTKYADELDQILLMREVLTTTAEDIKKAVAGNLMEAGPSGPSDFSDDGDASTAEPVTASPPTTAEPDIDDLVRAARDLRAAFLKALDGLGEISMVVRDQHKAKSDALFTKVSAELKQACSAVNKIGSERDRVHGILSWVVDASTEAKKLTSVAATSERLRAVQGTAGILAEQLDEFLNELAKATAHVRAAQGEEERLPRLVGKLAEAEVSRASLTEQARWVQAVVDHLVNKVEPLALDLVAADDPAEAHVRVTGPRVV